MDILNLVIDDMNKEDVRFYKLFANRLYFSHDRKDLLLFDYIKTAGEQYDEDKIMHKLYRPADKNTFYRLKNRLLTHVNKSLLLQHFENDDSMSVLAMLSMYKFHFARDNFKAAKYFLTKAEREALSLELLEVLDIIYSEFIKLSTETMDINPEIFIRKRKENLNHLNKIREIDQVLAAITYQIKVTQNYSQEGKSFTRTLEQIIRQHDVQRDVKNSRTLQMRLVNAVSRVLVKKHDYKTLETFINSKLKEFMRRKYFSKANHELKLQMHTYLVNCAYKNKNYKKSLSYTETLHDAMQEFDRMLYDKYLVFYNNALVINYGVLDPKKAIAMLEELKKSPVRKKLAYYEVFVYINLALLYFEEKNYDRSIRQIIDVSLIESFRKTDDALKLKVAIAELMIRYELDEFDVIEYRVSQIMRRYRLLLQSKMYIQEKEMMGIIQKLNSGGGKKSNEKLIASISAFIAVHQRHADDDPAFIKYIPWLKEKLAGLKGTGVRQ